MSFLLFYLATLILIIPGLALYYRYLKDRIDLDEDYKGDFKTVAIILTFWPFFVPLLLGIYGYLYLRFKYFI